MLVVAAEGVDDAMRAAWAEERSALGPRAAAVELVETGAAVLLEAREISSKLEEQTRFLEGCLFFEPEARRAAARFLEWVNDVAARAAGDPVPKAAVTLCTPDYEEFLEGQREEMPRVERFGVAGMFEIAHDVARIPRTAPSPHFPSKRIRAYVTRDVTGAVAAVALESWSS
jgi:hypothetical protein